MTSQSADDDDPISPANARILSVLLLCPPADLEGFRRRMLGKDSPVPVERLRTMRGVLMRLSKVLMGGTEAAWVKVAEVRDALDQVPEDAAKDRPAEAPAAPAPPKATEARAPSAGPAPPPPAHTAMSGPPPPLGVPDSPPPSVPPGPGETKRMTRIPAGLPMPFTPPTQPRQRTISSSGPSPWAAPSPVAPTSLAPAPVPPLSMAPVPVPPAPSSSQETPSPVHASRSVPAPPPVPPPPPPAVGVSAASTGTVEDIGGETMDTPIAPKGALPFRRGPSQLSEADSRQLGREAARPPVDLGATQSSANLSPFHSATALPFEGQRAGGASPTTPPISGPTLSIEQYASLCASCAEFPDRLTATHQQYGIADARARDQIDTSFRRRFEQEPALRRQFDELLDHYRRWFRQNAPR